MTSTTTRRIALLLAATVVLSVFLPTVLAAPTVDSETTTTTSTSALTDGTTQATFNASDDVQLPTLQASYATTNPAIQVVDPATGEVMATFKNESDPGYFTSTGGTGPYYFNTTLNESDLATVPMDANQNKSVTLRLFDNGSKMDVSASTNVTVYLENTDERAVVHAGSTAADDGGIADVEETEKGFILTSTENVTTLEADNVGVNGTATDVYVVYADDTVAEPYETAAANKSTWFGLSTADYETGDRIQDQVLFVESTPYGIYNEDVPDAAENADTLTHSTYTTLNGEPVHVIDLGDTYEDETNVDIETIGNEKESSATGIERVQTLDTGGFFSLQTAPGVYGQAGA